MVRIQSNLTVQQRANAHDDWRDIGVLVQSPFWEKRQPNRYAFKSTGEWLEPHDLLDIACLIEAKV